jgi:hypothetical protein
MMNLFKMLSLFIAAMVSLCAMTGCQQAKPTSEPQATTVVAPAVPQDTLTTWLATAPEPTMVSSSVNRSVAPEAVDRFNAISEKVSAIYSAVYAEAQEAATARASGDVMSDAVLAKAVEGVATTPGTNWKTMAQNAVIANYQATANVIAEQKATITAYTESLKTDESIMSLTNQVEKTAVLFTIGKDTAELGRQLKAASDGASAIRMRRMSTALGK